MESESSVEEITASSVEKLETDLNNKDGGDATIRCKLEQSTSGEFLTLTENVEANRTYVELEKYCLHTSSNINNDNTDADDRQPEVGSHGYQAFKAHVKTEDCILWGQNISDSERDVRTWKEVFETAYSSGITVMGFAGSFDSDIVDSVVGHTDELYSDPDRFEWSHRFGNNSSRFRPTVHLVEIKSRQGYEQVLETSENVFISKQTLASIRNRQSARGIKQRGWIDFSKLAKNDGRVIAPIRTDFNVFRILLALTGAKITIMTFEQVADRRKTNKGGDRIRRLKSERLHDEMAVVA
jgi:hypothetical protein